MSLSPPVLNESSVVSGFNTFARTIKSLLLVAVAATSLNVFAGQALATPSENEARQFFGEFVAAHNDHNVQKVKSMLWDSPKMLWFTRGESVLGPDAVVDRLKEYYKGAWHLQPDMSKFTATAITDDCVQIVVPIIFTRSLPGQPAHDTTFLISQTYIRSIDGWRVASIMALADSSIK